MKGTVLNPLDSDVKTIRINVATYAGKKHVTVVITHDLDKNYAIYCAVPLEGYPIKGLNLSPTVYVETGVYLVTFSRPDGPDEDAVIDSYILTALDLFLKRVSGTVTHHATCNVLISGLMPSLLDLLFRIHRRDSGTSPSGQLPHVKRTLTATKKRARCTARNQPGQPFCLSLTRNKVFKD